MPRLLALLTVLALPLAASAEPEASEPRLVPLPDPVAEITTPEDDPAAASLAGVGASLVPGFLVHGSGLWVSGERDTARRLLAIEGIGLAMAAAGGVALAVSGGNRRVSPPTIPLVVSGFGLFTQSWLADIYGSAGGARRGAAASAEPAVALELGALAIHDPAFDYGGFSRVAAEIIAGRWRVAPELLVGFGDDNQRLRGDLAYRLIAPRAGDGTRLELGGGFRGHRYGGDEFTSYSAELVSAGRLDLHRIGPSLSGSFATLAAGWGLEVTDYHLEGAGSDLADQILVRFGFGLYLGDPTSFARGELSLYYDHRRDDLVAGLSPGQQASGFAGYFGAGLDLDLGERWGLASRVELGSALLVSAAARLRFGGAR